MFIDTVKIQNYKGIKQAEIHFNKGVNLIIGNNGAGKTSILSGIAVSLGSFIDRIVGIPAPSIHQDDIHIEQKKIGEATYESKECYPCDVISTIDLPGGEADYGRGIRYDKDKGLEHYQIRRYDIGLDKDSSGIFPLISYQQFDRGWSIKGGNREDITIRTGFIQRKDGYENCLSGRDYEEQIQKWCLKMALMEFEKKAEIKEFRTFQCIIKRFLQSIEATDEEVSIGYSSDFNGLAYNDGNTNMPIYDLSTGYRALLSMILELAYRTVVLNPEISEDLDELTGVVLIDEIDAHLHPEWQWKIIDTLVEVFPNVQFIIATHSPMIISSAKKANIISIGTNMQLDYLQSAYGFSADDVLTLRQGTLEMPQKSKDYLEKLEQAIDQDDIGAAKDIIESAKNEYGEDSVIVFELVQMFRLNTGME